jgi:large subunit ribosomal protein L3
LTGIADHANVCRSKELAVVDAYFIRKDTMALGIIGRKIGMTHQFDEKGNAIPVSVIQAGPCTIVQKKTLESDSYSALQIGFDEHKVKQLTKPDIGRFKKAGVTPKRILKEIRLTGEEAEKWSQGEDITLKAFEDCKFVDVTGYSKGRGYTGVIKRHNFSMPKATHGTHEKFRHGGSLGCRFPQHVAKGKKMAGQHGNTKSTVQNLKVFAIRPEENLILIRGAVPGPNNAYVVIRTALKKPTAA